LDSIGCQNGNEILLGETKCSNCCESFLIRKGILDLATKVDRILQDEVRHWDSAAKIKNWNLSDTEVSAKLRPRISELISGAIGGWGRRIEAVVLEICCGEGTAIDLLPDVARKVHYIGIDISMGMLLKTGKRRRRNWKIDLIRADANRQILKDGAANLCFSFAALHHLDLDGAIRSISSTLSEGGILILYEPNKYNMLRLIGRNLIRSFYSAEEKSLSPFETRAIAKSLGMILCQEQGLYPVGLPFSFLIGYLKNRRPKLAEKLKTLTQ